MSVPDDTVNIYNIVAFEETLELGAKLFGALSVFRSYIPNIFRKHVQTSVLVSAWLYYTYIYICIYIYTMWIILVCHFLSTPATALEKGGTILINKKNVPSSCGLQYEMISSHWTLSCVVRVIHIIESCRLRHNEMIFNNYTETFTIYVALPNRSYNSITSLFTASLSPAPSSSSEKSVVPKLDYVITGSKPLV